MDENYSGNSSEKKGTTFSFCFGFFFLFLKWQEDLIRKSRKNKANQPKSNHMTRSIRYKKTIPKKKRKKKKKEKR